MIEICAIWLKALILKGRIGGAKRDRTADLYTASVVACFSAISKLFEINKLENALLLRQSPNQPTKLQLAATKSRKFHAANWMARTIPMLLFPVNFLFENFPHSITHQKDNNK